MLRWPKRLSILLALALLFAGWSCTPTDEKQTDGDVNSDGKSGGDVKVVEKTEVVPPPGVKEHWNKASGKKGTTQIEPIFYRKARRLSVIQLKKSLPKLFGGITWTLKTRTAEYNNFDRLSKTLGQADYLQMTITNLDPSPLFMKFMDDMAGQVCRKAVERDFKQKDPKARVIVRYSDPAQNLRFLRLKFHSLWIPPNSDRGIKGLLTLFNKIKAKFSSKTDPKRGEREAWIGVCIAILTSPEFLSY